MIGFVSPSLQAIVRLQVRGKNEDNVGAVIDTGFSGFLALPGTLIQSLGLEFSLQVVTTLADGSDVLANLYAGQVEWNGQWQQIDILHADGGALIGMALLEGSQLTIDVRDGGRVLVEAL